MPRGKRLQDEEYSRPQTAKRGRVPTNTRRNPCLGVAPQAPPAPPAPPPPAPPVSASFSQRICIKWFQQYVKDDPDNIEPDGMEIFCKDVGVDPSDVVMLVIAWKMSAKRMGFFSMTEWLHGFTELKCDSKEKIIAKLDDLRSLLREPVIFKSIYRYAFDFAKDKDQRSMDIETSKDMLKLLLADQWSLFLYFVSFLDGSKYRVINKDQWSNILEFARSIRDDLTNYDVDGAWPVMLDEFVEWLNKTREGEGGK